MAWKHMVCHIHKLDLGPHASSVTNEEIFVKKLLSVRFWNTDEKEGVEATLAIAKLFALHANVKKSEKS